MKEILGTAGVLLVTISYLIQDIKLLSGILAFIGFIFILIAVIMTIKGYKNIKK